MAERVRLLLHALLHSARRLVRASGRSAGFVFKKLVPAQGFEPWTVGLKVRRSAKLSYAGRCEAESIQCV